MSESRNWVHNNLTHENAHSSDSSLGIIINELNQSLACQDLQKSLELMQVLQSAHPKHSEFCLKLGHLLYKVKDYVKAEDFYKQALQGHKSSSQIPEIYFGLGQTYFQLKLLSDSFLAFSIIEQGYETSQFIEIARLKLAQILIATNDNDAAMKFLLKLLHKKNISRNILTETFCCIGKIYEEEGKKRLALKFYIRAAALLKTFRTISCLAWVYLNFNPEMTEKICKKYLEVNRPQYQQCDIGLLQAIAMIKLKKFAEALVTLKIMIFHYPKNVFYLQYLGYTCFMLKLYGKALEWFQKVAEILPENFENLNNLSVVYKNLEFHKESFAMYYRIALLNGTKSIEFEAIQILEPQISVFDFPSN